HLYAAERLYRRGAEISHNNKDGFQRGVARNLIAQHRFKEAHEILKKSYAGVSKKHGTELILFDTAMELGHYTEANTYLGKVKNMSDYHYLIRLAKWSDHEGNLDAAIKYLERAQKIAETGNSKDQLVWVYATLGDFYGHAGRIREAYAMYLKTLKLQPENAHVKKGIAWIAYAAEKDTPTANRILDSILKTHAMPDHYLLKAEMAEYNGNKEQSERYTTMFVEMATNGNYGAMYRPHLVEIYAGGDPKKALALAKAEVAARATPQTYSLLAYAQLQNNKKEEALKTIENHVAGKTPEPMAAYYSALVYKANGMHAKVKPIKEELQAAWFEMGPVLSKKIRSL
ncbi:MAG: tetratricopeptide repeat protein, partial [Marinirhabdus sp.]